MSHQKIADAVEASYGFKGSVHRLGGYGENYLIALADGQKFVLKLESEYPGREPILLEHAAVEAAFESGAGIGLPRLVPDLGGNIVVGLDLGADEPRLGRLLRFVPGCQWRDEAPASADLLTSLGTHIGHLAVALSSLDLPAARRTHDWDLAGACAYRSYLPLIADRDRRRLLAIQAQRWAASRQDLANVPRGLIHGDLNDENLLVLDGQLSGILDFTDALHNPLICDLAILLAYILLDEPDPWHAGARVVAGYHTVRPLSPTEVELLYPLICARLEMCVLHCARNRQIEPERAALFVTEERAWAFLEKHGDSDPTEVADLLASLIDVRPYPDRGGGHPLIS